MILWRRLLFERRTSRFARLASVPRTPPSVPGTITLDWRSFGCRLSGLTATGAVLDIDMPRPPKLPRYFFVRPDSDRTHRRVRLTWQHGKQAGVEFITRWAIAW